MSGSFYLEHFRYRKDLTQHEKTSHPSQTSCPFCKRDFDSADLFEEHKRAKRFWGWGQFTHPGCDDKKFCYAKDLKEHIANQGLEAKPIKCPSCSKESDINAVEGCFQECLEKHLHDGVKLRYPNVQCSSCFEEFDIADFENHAEMCTSTSHVGEAQLVCLLCRKSFSYNAHADHMKSHIDEVLGLKDLLFISQTKTMTKQLILNLFVCC